MTTILTHHDGDGICSAALVKMTKKYRDATVIFTHPMGLAQDLKKIEDDLIICDIALDTRVYKIIYEKFKDLTDYGFEVIYLDHHARAENEKLPKKVTDILVEDVSATEIVYRFFYKQLPKWADHIALIGAISDYLDNTALMRELLHNYERRTLFLDAGILAQGVKIYGYNNYDHMRNLVERFAQGFFPVEIKELVKAAIRITKSDKEAQKHVLASCKKGKNIAWVRNPKASKSKSAHWIVGGAGKLVGIVIRDHSRRPEIADLTIRGRNLVDLREVVPKIAHNLGGTGGGHPNAVGCRIPIEKLEIFLEILDKTITALEIPSPPSIEDLINLPKLNLQEISRIKDINRFKLDEDDRK